LSIVLELRPNCELCDIDLPPAATEARICSYECTFCADCVDTALGNVCPNCGGGFTPRPIRPAHAWRDGTGLVNDPPTPHRRHSAHSREAIDAFTATLRETAPERR
jgi:hypothetical protein